MGAIRRLGRRLAEELGRFLVLVVEGDAPRERARWREAAPAAGLAGVEDAGDGVAGWAGPLRVRLTGYADATSRGTRITVSGPGMPSGLTIRPESLVSAVRGLRGVREVETGHDVFDARAWIEGDATLARAVLDADTRRAILALFDGRLDRRGRTPFFASGALERGVLRVDVPREKPRTPSGSGGDDAGRGFRAGDAYLDPLAHLPEVLSEVLALARRLATPPDLALRLAGNLRAEPVAGVRRQCLLTLAREFPDHPAAREALLAAREDPDAEVRLKVGVALGPEGRQTLLGLASGEGADDETTERAVAALGWHLTTPHALTILRNALRTRREATARACLHALGRRRGPEAVAALAKVLALEEPSLASVAAEALGETGDAGAEAPLLEALDGPHEAVRAAAARALGRVGTTAAVGPLREAETRDGTVRAAARQAVAEIQSRAKGALPGQLSLAESGAGALSIVEDEPGRLSLAEGEGADRGRAPRRPARVRE